MALSEDISDTLAEFAFLCKNHYFPLSTRSNQRHNRANRVSREKLESAVGPSFAQRKRRPFDVNRAEAAMNITKSILCFWTGCSAFSCFSAYGIGYERASQSIVTMESLDLGGGQAFAIGFPPMLSEALAVVGAVMAVVGLLASCRLNKQPVFSWPHGIALFFLLPLGFALLMP
jgi:hypothetical protein